MAKKTFCDLCGDEISQHDVTQGCFDKGEEVRLRGHEGELTVKVTISIRSEKSFDLCKQCMHYIVGMTDHSPKTKAGAG